LNAPISSSDCFCAPSDQRSFSQGAGRGAGGTGSGDIVGIVAFTLASTPVRPAFGSRSDPVRRSNRRSNLTRESRYLKSLAASFGKKRRGAFRTGAGTADDSVRRKTGSRENRLTHDQSIAVRSENENNLFWCSLDRECPAPPERWESRPA